MQISTRKIDPFAVRKTWALAPAYSKTAAWGVGAALEQRGFTVSRPAPGVTAFTGGWRTAWKRRAPLDVAMGRGTVVVAAGPAGTTVDVELRIHSPGYFSVLFAGAVFCVAVLPFWPLRFFYLLCLFAIYWKTRDALAFHVMQTVGSAAPAPRAHRDGRA